MPRPTVSSRERFPRGLFLLLPGLAWTMLLTPRVAAQWMQQSIPLNEGWNSVFLVIDPAPELADNLFTDPVIRSVWGYSPDSLTAGVPDCSNPSNPGPECPPPDENHWQTWVPPNDPANYLNTLRVIRGGRVYLINSATSTVLNLVGIPSSGATEWRAGLNLVGFHVEDDAVDFSTFLQASPAHQSSEIYEPTMDGEWAEVAEPAETRIRAGRGYWTTASAATDYSGPIRIDDGSLRGVDFGRLMTDHTVTLENLSTVPANISLNYASSAQPPQQPTLAGDVPLTWLDYGAGGDIGSVYQWRSLGSGSWALGPMGMVNGTCNIRMAIVRAGLQEALVDVGGSGSQYQGLIRVTNGDGFERFLPVTAQRGPSAGLWVGDVTVNQVSYVLADAGTEITRPTAQEFSFRILLHDSGSVVKLLTEVTLMVEPSGTPGQPGTPVLITPDVSAGYLATLEPASMQGGGLFAPRVSSAAFSFDDDLAFSSGDIGGVLNGTTTIASTDRLNPFRHKYHPDHDGDNLGEVYTVTRDFEMTFSPAPPPGFVGSGFGATVWAGTWEESLTGLHSATIKVRGDFRIYQVSTIAVLNGPPQ